MLLFFQLDWNLENDSGYVKGWDEKMVKWIIDDPWDQLIHLCFWPHKRGSYVGHHTCDQLLHLTLVPFHLPLNRGEER